MILGGGYIYRSYLLKKKLNAILDERNNAIEEQADLLRLKNNKLGAIQLHSDTRPQGSN